MKNETTSNVSAAKTVKAAKRGRPVKNISRDALRKAVRACSATERIAACHEIGKTLNCCWLTVYRTAQRKGVKLPMGVRGAKPGSKHAA